MKRNNIYDFQDSNNTLSFKDFPRELIVFLATFLSVRDLLNLRLLSKEIQKLTCQNEIWNFFLMREFKFIYTNDIKNRYTDNISPEKIFIQYYEEMKRFDINLFVNVKGNARGIGGIFGKKVGENIKFWTEFKKVLDLGRTDLVERLLESIKLRSVFTPHASKPPNLFLCNDVAFKIEALIIPLKNKNFSLFKLLHNSLDQNTQMGILLYLIKIPYYCGYTFQYDFEIRKSNTLSMCKLSKDEIEPLITYLQYLDKMKVKYLSPHTLEFIVCLAGKYESDFPNLIKTVSELELFKGHAQEILDKFEKSLQLSNDQEDEQSNENNLQL